MKTKANSIIVIFVALIFGCKKDEVDNVIISPPNIIFEARIGDNYFKEIEHDGYIFLSREDGSLIDFKMISNNDIVFFSSDDTTLTDFTVTIAANRLHPLPDSNGIQLNSYIAVPVGSIWRLDKIIRISEPIESTANVRIKNAGEITYSPLEVWGSNSMGNSLDNSNGDLLLKLFTNLPTSILAIYQSKIDNKIRFLYKDEILIGETLAVEQNSLPIIDTPITIDVGQNEFDGLNILGYPIGGSKRPFGLSRLTNVTGITQHYFPTELFNRFLSYGHGWLSNDTRFYTKKTTTLIEPVFSIPDYDYEVVGNDSGFVLTSNSVFDYATICYRKENGFVTWRTTGEAKSNISFEFPDIPTEVLNDYSALSNQLTFSNAYGYKNTPSIPYLEFLGNQFRLDSTFVSEIKNERIDIIIKKS
jgi:hypothetical protein